MNFTLVFTFIGLIMLFESIDTSKYSKAMGERLNIRINYHGDPSTINVTIFT